MTDQELSSFGERLYGAILRAHVSDACLRDLTVALRARTPWKALPSGTKLSLLIAAAGLERPAEELSDAAPSGVDAGVLPYLEPPPPVAIDDDLSGPAVGPDPAPTAESGDIGAGTATCARLGDEAVSEPPAVEDPEAGPPSPATIEALGEGETATEPDEPAKRRARSRG